MTRRQVVIGSLTLLAPVVICSTASALLPAGSFGAARRRRHRPRLELGGPGAGVSGGAAEGSGADLWCGCCSGSGPWLNLFGDGVWVYYRRCALGASRRPGAGPTWAIWPLRGGSRSADPGLRSLQGPRDALRTLEASLDATMLHHRRGRAELALAALGPMLEGGTARRLSFWVNLSYPLADLIDRLRLRVVLPGLPGFGQSGRLRALHASLCASLRTSDRGRHRATSR